MGLGSPTPAPAQGGLPWAPCLSRPSRQQARKATQSSGPAGRLARTGLTSRSGGREAGTELPGELGVGQGPAGQLEASSQSTVALGTLPEMQSSQSGPQPRPRPPGRGGCLSLEPACFPAQAAPALGAPTCSSIGEKETLRVSKGPGVRPGPPAACGDWGAGGACEGVLRAAVHRPRGPGPAHTPTRCLLKPGLGPPDRREGAGME